MATWSEFSAAEPDLARRVEALFTGYKHHTMATIRRDGAPRISGTEVELEGGELVLGMMPGTRRAADLRRDPRIAIHSHSVDPPADDPAKWLGEAKVAGRAVATSDDEAVDRFRIEIAEVAFTHLNQSSDQLLVESWIDGRGVTVHRR